MQLQLLTAIVKLFLKRPTDTQDLVQQVLSLATQVRILQNIHHTVSVHYLQNYSLLVILGLNLHVKRKFFQLWIRSRLWIHEGCIYLNTTWRLFILIHYVGNRIATTQIWETGATYTGGFCPLIQRQLRRWFWLRSHSFQRRQIWSSPRCWTS